jgi:endoglycosylceramidase
MFKKLKNLIAIGCLIRSAEGQVAENLKLHVEGNRIKDYDGRERIFHGTNVIEKRFPFVPVTDSFNPLNSFSKEDAEFIAEIGYNTIRLGVLWAGFEPE